MQCFRSVRAYPIFQRSTVKIPGVDLPAKPKRPGNAYVQFCAVVLPQIREEYSTSKLKDLMKQAALMWQSADEKTKTKYQVIYAAKVEKYKEELDKFNDNLSEEQRSTLAKHEKQELKEKRKRKIKKKMKLLGRPKKPPTVFGIFMKENYDKSKVEQGNHRKYFKELTEKWNSLSDAEKEVYQIKAKELMKTYYQEVEEWKLSLESSDGDLTTKKKEKIAKEPTLEN